MDALMNAVQKFCAPTPKF